MPHTVDEPYRGPNPRAYNFTKEWKKNTEIARAYLEKASKRMKKWADTGRTPRQFEVGDLVLIKLLLEQMRYLRKRDKRLVRKYEGPLPIISKVGKAAYKIQLPKWLKVHPVFHVCNLKPYHADPNDPSRSTSTRPAINLKQPRREVEEILADRVVQRTRRHRQEYLVKWRGRGEEETSWEQAEDLQPFRQKIKEFHASKSTRTSTA